MTNAMLRVMAAGVLAAIPAMPALPAQAAVAPPRIDLGSVQGAWRNQKNTVHIRTYACGEEVCGEVTWATPEAEQDARRGGTQQLRGTQIFREFRPVGDGGYRGKVFVPDMNRTFAGHLSVTPDDKLQGKGCILGGLICKTSIWVRLQ